MSHTETSKNYDHFLPQRNSLLIRGLLMTTAGFLLTLMSAINPNAQIMSQQSSWLPLVAIVVLITGALGCLDAFISRHSKEFYINLQIASMDTVMGIFLLTELNKSADKLILLAAAYLLIKGLFRFFAAIRVGFSNAESATLGGLLSIVLGILLWQEWPFSSMWFICFCLSIDIMTRGWALVRFGVWLRTLHQDSSREA